MKCIGEKNILMIELCKMQTESTELIPVYAALEPLCLSLFS